MLKPFAKLTELSTDKKAYLYGLLPSISTVLTLLAVSAVVAMAPILWASATLQASLYMSSLAYSILAVTGLATLNFWFNREIQFYTLGCSPINPGDKFAQYDIVSMVNHLVQELNLRDGTTDPNHPNHLRVPRLAKFTGTSPKIITVHGRDVNTSAIYISDFMLNEYVTRYSQRELAALLQAELYQIKRRRSIPDTLLGVVESLTKTLDSLMSSQNLFLQALGYALVPLKICFYIHNAILRTHVYEAAKAVVECGRGEDYYSALDRKGHASRTKKRSSEQYKLGGNLRNRMKLERDPYEHPCTDYMMSKPWLRPLAFVGRFIDWMLKPLADWVDKKEYTTDEKTQTYRAVVFFDIVFRYAAFYFKEVHAASPSGPNLKAYISTLQKDGSLDKTPYRVDEGDRYDPIDPIENIRHRFKRATFLSRDGKLSFGQVKEKACMQQSVLEFAESARKQCKERILNFLTEEKGIQPTKEELANLLKPLIFTHNEDDLKVEIEHNASQALLNQFLQLKGKQDLNDDLDALYATQSIPLPALR